MKQWLHLSATSSALNKYRGSHAYLDLSYLLVCPVLQVLTLLFQLVHLALGGMQLFPCLRQVCLAGRQVLPHALCLQLC